MNEHAQDCTIRLGLACTCGALRTSGRREGETDVRLLRLLVALVASIDQRLARIETSLASMEEVETTPGQGDERKR